MKPLLLQVGLAAAVSLTAARYIYSSLSTAWRRRQAPRPSGAGSGRRPYPGLKDRKLLHLRNPERAPPNVCTSKVSAAAAAAAAAAVTPARHGLSSPSIKNPGSKEEHFLAEVDSLMLQAFGSRGMDTVSAVKSSSAKTVPAPEKNEAEVADKAVIILETIAHSLREGYQEIPATKFYGLEEQKKPDLFETEGCLKLGESEAEVLSAKLQSLQAQNLKLAAQVSDHSQTTAELEAAKAKVRHLKRRMKYESARASERIVALRRRIAALRDSEGRRKAAAEQEAERRLKDLEGEVEELGRTNSRLTIENSNLANNPKSTEFIASSAGDSHRQDQHSVIPEEQAEAAEETRLLRREKDELAERIRQLEMDRYADAEELVYLRWINACLRYELRDYRPPPGRTSARDLSRTLSPESERTVKQLIHDYADSGIDEKSINLADFDSECGSSTSQASLGHDAGDAAVAVADASAATAGSTAGGGSTASGKKKFFFAKLKRLVLGKDRESSSRRPPATEDPSNRGSKSERIGTSASARSPDEIVGADEEGTPPRSTATDDAALGRYQLLAAGEKADGKPLQPEFPWIQGLSTVSLDFLRLRSLPSPDVPARMFENPCWFLC